jgi:hypothetical protein
MFDTSRGTHYFFASIFLSSLKNQILASALMRGDNTADTATSRAKKSESPVLKAMNKYMSDIAKIQAQRNEYFRQRLAAKQQKEDAKREKN